ncbi:MAG: ORF6N domain-containing protein [Pyrinomonadaceae bacterium]
MKQTAAATSLTNTVETRILLVRGQKVLLDSDLAEIYGVETRALNQAVKRNQARFPGDFMFQLSLEETDELKALKSQIVILSNASNNISPEKQKRGSNIKHRPFVFTEHGAVMLASVLNSATAVEASIQVVRAFIRLRSILSEHHEFEQRLEEIEKKYDAQFRTVFVAIKELMKPPSTGKRKIGFLQAEQNRLFD